MSSIGIIYGRDSEDSNAFSKTRVLAAFSSGASNIYDAYHAVNGVATDEVSLVIEGLFHLSGPTLIFGLLNGRTYPHNGQTTLQPQPQFLNGRSDSTKSILADIVMHAKAHCRPVDVFMLMGSNPEIIRPYAKELPAGSTLVAVKTPPDSRLDTHFWSVLDDPDIFRSMAPTARNILTCYLAASGPIMGAPAIAVAGVRKWHANDVWEQYVRGPAHGTADQMAAAQDRMNRLMPFMSSQQMQSLSNAKLLLDRLGSKAKPTTSPAYAWALATLWDDFFGNKPAAEPAKTIDIELELAPVAAASLPAESTATRDDGDSGGYWWPAPAAGSTPHRSSQQSRQQAIRALRPGKPLLKQLHVINRLIRRGIKP